jgi:phosphatidate cytidylyltransferase
MALNMPTFYKRTGSAIVFGAIMLTGLLWDNEWAFLALICLINVLCLRDYFRLMQKIDTAAHWPDWLPLKFFAVSLLLIVTFSLRGKGPLESVLWACFRLLPLAVPGLLLACTLFKKNSLMALWQATGGLLYITVPMILLANMRAHDMMLPVALIAMIWINDTMAYIVGSFIGKTPFSPISPKKTWEGTAGGAILTIAAAVVYGHLSQQYRLIDWVAISLLTAVAGTLGDLLESKLKRMADVKDSGNMMPGHGGALDRFDSLIVAAPVVFVYVSWFM